MCLKIGNKLNFNERRPIMTEKLINVHLLAVDLENQLERMEVKDDEYHVGMKDCLIDVIGRLNNILDSK